MNDQPSFLSPEYIRAKIEQARSAPAYVSVTELAALNPNLAEYIGQVEAQLAEALSQREFFCEENKRHMDERDQLRGALALGQENRDAEYDRLRAERDRWREVATGLAVCLKNLAFLAFSHAHLWDAKNFGALAAYDALKAKENQP